MLFPDHDTPVVVADIDLPRNRGRTPEAVLMWTQDLLHDVIPRTFKLRASRPAEYSLSRTVPEYSQEISNLGSSGVM
jgi:hypothetical protein